MREKTIIGGAVMNTQRNKNSVIIIALIMAAVATSLFLVVKVTMIFIIAYIFMLIGIAAFCAGNLYLISSSRSYPWFAAFPLRIWQYIVVQFLLSAGFVIWASQPDSSAPVEWFFVLHIVVAAFFTISLILLKSGKEIIERRDDEVKDKVTTLGFMYEEVKSLARRLPAHEKALNKVADALRYSDPMSPPSLAAYEQQIQKNILALSDLEGNETAKIPEKCETLLIQIADRNSRVKMLK
jgi:hypothetical protein